MEKPDPCATVLAYHGTLAPSGCASNSAWGSVVPAPEFEFAGLAPSVYVDHAEQFALEHAVMSCRNNTSSSMRLAPPLVTKYPVSQDVQQLRL
jgi:hypothetical protein